VTQGGNQSCFQTSEHISDFIHLYMKPYSHHLQRCNCSVEVGNNGARRGWI